MTEEKIKAILEKESMKIFHAPGTLKQMGATKASGATKKVLVFPKKGFVLKCDRYPNEDSSYCKTEAENYNSAVSAGIEKILLPTTKFCTCADGIVFYKQPIYKSNSVLDADGERTVDDKIQPFRSCTKRERKVARIINLFYSHSSLYNSEKWMARAIQYYGTDFMKEVANWTMENDVNDLHGGNLGYIGNYRPIILDYSGYWG